MGPLDLVALRPLMERSRGSPEIAVAVIDGPVKLDHPELARQQIHEIPGRSPAACLNRDSAACIHGTFVVGMLAANRGSVAPAICPGCTFLVRPIFSETPTGNGKDLSATPEELAAAIQDTVHAGARVLNLSVGLAQPWTKGERQLDEALSYAASQGVITVVAAGNQGAIGSSVLTRHPWVLPVVACDELGQLVLQSNLAGSIGRNGVSAPGQGIMSLGAAGEPLTMDGTSAATPFATGTMALLWSIFPRASAGAVKLAVTRSATGRRASIVPPPLNAWAAYQALATSAATV